MEAVANPYKIQDIAKSIDSTLSNQVSKKEFRTETPKRLEPDQ